MLGRILTKRYCVKTRASTLVCWYIKAANLSYAVQEFTRNNRHQFGYSESDHGRMQDFVFKRGAPLRNDVTSKPNFSFLFFAEY